jgi:hypothetical protein
MLTLCGLMPTAYGMGELLDRAKLSHRFGLINRFFSASITKEYCHREDNTEADSQQKIFEENKSKLPVSLRAFLDDFQSWPKEDKDKIEIFGLSFVISQLSAEKEARYGGSIGYWIDCRTNSQQQRQLFISCLKHLQK